MSMGQSALYSSAVDALQARMGDDTPRSFAHDLHLHPAFAPGSLTLLAARYDDFPGDYYIAAGAEAADTPFSQVFTPRLKPSEALAQIEASSWRVLLKRPEKHSVTFRRLLAEIRGTIARQFPNDPITRIEAGIFITSAASITPFHFDPEMALFSQIEGDKRYHVYSPSVLSEPELETFYARGIVEIGQVGLKDRDPGLETIFDLRAGAGFYQPQNAPHWVETIGTRSVSYTVAFETLASQRSGASRAFNHLLRHGGLTPHRLGRHPAMDSLKARGMRPAMRVWKGCKRLSARLSTCF